MVGTSKAQGLQDLRLCLGNKPFRNERVTGGIIPVLGEALLTAACGCTLHVSTLFYHNPSEDALFSFVSGMVSKLAANKQCFMHCQEQVT